jgi:hypothetical protein
MWTAAAPLPVLPEQRRTLESWIRAHNTPQSVVLRARIVLLAADGKANHAIAERLKTRTTVLLWRERFVKQGPPGLRKVAPGRGRKPSIPATTIRQIIDQTVRCIYHVRPFEAHVGIRESGPRVAAG